MKPLIQAEGLSKSYLIGHQGDRQPYATLRESLAVGGRRLARRLLHPLRASTGMPLEGEEGAEEFWALQDVSFEVGQGERVGIIGRNGAGKSTLLKILSRITEPTRGRVILRGRVASLLEVGTGFHPELTGRENIYLNGAVLGMSRAEIRGRFDEIVAFAEVEKFLDTPVKRYSSGMYVRLAFAVAAHLEPEILIVDEVLAVGDAQFQKKCLGKMEEVGKAGKTVLFVSHNMSAVKALCGRALLLESGRVCQEGVPAEVVKRYLEANEPETGAVAQRTRDRKQSLRAKILEATLLDREQRAVTRVSGFEPLVVKLKVQAFSRLSCSFWAHVRRSGERVIWMDSGTVHGKMFDLGPGTYEVFCEIDSLMLATGDYSIDCGISVPYVESIDSVLDALAFEVIECDPYEVGFDYSRIHGTFNPPHRWRM